MKQIIVFSLVIITLTFSGLVIGDNTLSNSEAVGKKVIAAGWVRLLSGELVQVVGKRDKPLYLKFWATWCGGCLKQMPHLQKIHETYIKELDVIIINIGLNDSLEQIARIQKKFELTLPIVFDELGDISRHFDIEVVPYSILINRKGHIIHRGWGDDGIAEKIENLVGAL